jgi:hypothetical protein
VVAFNSKIKIRNHEKTNMATLEKLKDKTTDDDYDEFLQFLNE